MTISNDFLEVIDHITPIVIFSANGELCYANELFSTMFDHNAGQLKNLGVEDLFEHASVTELAVKMSEGKHWWEEVLVKTGLGELIPYQAKCIPVLEGAQVAICLMERSPGTNPGGDDKTLQSISRNLTEGLYRSTESGKIIYVNDAFVRMFGYDSVAEVKTLKASCFYVEPTKRQEILNRLHNEHNIINNEVLLKRKNGEVFWGLLSTSESRDETGQVVYDGVLRDISGFKEIERQLKIEKRRAEEASSAKEQFLSTMSHELRTPMNAVIGLTHLLLGENPKPEQVENLKTLKFSAENLMHIINDILDFSKIEAGKVELELVPFGFHELLHNITESFGPKADQKGIQLQIEIDENIPQYLMGDSVRLSQIFNNLISNAVKFTYHGNVDVKIQLVEDYRDRVKLRCSVKDTGIGIPANKIDAIFNLFTQASSTTTRRFGGTGLGLTITKRLVELLGGSLKVESQPGYGTEFHYSIDLNKVVATSVPKEPITASAPERDSLEGVKILAAEDNEVNQILLRKFMRLWGVEIELAVNGQEVIEMVKSKEFDLVLMDIQMPVMDGYQACRKIRSMEDPYFKRLPIVAVTASALLEVQNRVMEAGMNDYVNKPFSPEQLFDKINHWISVPTVSDS